MNDLSYAYHKQGMLDEAEKKSRMGIALQEKVYDDSHPYIAYSLKNLSAICLEQGKGVEADSAIRKAIAMISEYHAKDDRVVAPFISNLRKFIRLMDRSPLPVNISIRVLG